MFRFANITILLAGVVFACAVILARVEIRRSDQVHFNPTKTDKSIFEVTYFRPPLDKDGDEEYWNGAYLTYASEEDICNRRLPGVGHLIYETYYLLLTVPQEGLEECNLKRKILHAEAAGYAGLIIQTQSSTKIQIPKAQQDILNDFDFPRVNSVTFVNFDEGEKIRRKYSFEYAGHSKFTIKFSPSSAVYISHALFGPLAIGFIPEFRPTKILSAIINSFSWIELQDVWIFFVLGFCTFYLFKGALAIAKWIISSDSTNPNNSTRPYPHQYPTTNPAVPNANVGADPPTRTPIHVQIPREVNSWSPPTRPTNTFEQSPSLPSLDGTINNFEQLREVLYQMYSVRQLFAPVRTNFVAWLVEAFRSSGLHLLQKPYAHFPNEEGIDDGALTKEMYRLAYDAILNKTISVDGQIVSLFEGEEDRRVPCQIPGLVKTFKSIGRFMVHAAIHNGCSLPGLNPAIAHYLCSKSNEIPTQLLTIGDLPDYDLRLIVERMDQWSTMSRAQISDLRDTALAAGYRGEFSEHNKEEIKMRILKYHVILKIKPQLDALKQPFIDSGLTDFLQLRPHLIGSMFPTVQSLAITKQMLVNNIQCFGNVLNVCQIIDDYLTYSSDPDIVKKLLQAWTGSGFLPDKKLELYAVACKGKFAINACAMQMTVDSDMSKELLDTYLDHVCHKKAGFSAP